MKRKKIVIFLSVFYLLTFIYFFVSYFDIFHVIPVVALSKNLHAIQNETVMDISYIKGIKYGKVVSKKKKNRHIDIRRKKDSYYYTK